MAATVREINSCERPLPDNVDAERFVLGAIMTSDDGFLQAAGKIGAEDFSIEKHKRIFLRMSEIQERGARIDRITLANELMKHGQLQAVDGLAYLVSLDDGLPVIHNLAAYVDIVREKSMLRKIIAVSEDTISRCFGEEGPDTVLNAAEQALMKVSDGASRSSLSSPAQIVENYEGGINAFLDVRKRSGGLTTGFTRFDELTGGLREGELFILAARPGVGKTAWAINCAQHIATNYKNPKAVAIFSLEMSKESLLTRMLCAAARVDSQRFRAGYLNHEERQALQVALAELVEANIFIDDASSTNIFEIHSKVRRLQAEQDLGLVVVDYLQLMQGGAKRSESRVQEVSALSRGLKLMAKDLKVPFLVLSQLSRAPENRAGDHRPMLSDLRESGSIEQDADLVAFIFRESIYKPDKESLKGIAELILSKQRNGATGTSKLAWLARYTKFENYCNEHGEQVDD